MRFIVEGFDNKRKNFRKIVEAESKKEAIDKVQSKGLYLISVKKTINLDQNEEKEDKKEVKCKQCGGEMGKTLKIDKDYGQQTVGCLVFIIAIILLFLFPIGTLLGIVIMILSARMGYKKAKVWKCKNCGYYFNRAD